MQAEHLRERGPGGGAVVGREDGPGESERAAKSVSVGEEGAQVSGAAACACGAWILPAGVQGALGGTCRGQLGLGSLLGQGLWVMLEEGEWL